MVRSFVWRDVSGTVGGGGSNGRWTVVSSDKDCLRTKFGQILAEIPAKFENPSPNLVRGQS